MSLLYKQTLTKTKLCAWRQSYLPAQLVEHRNVCIHVVNVVGVGGVLGDVPLLWFGALSREHVATVLGLIVHTVETCHLHTRKQTVNYTGSQVTLQQKFIFMFEMNAENINLLNVSFSFLS